MRPASSSQRHSPHPVDGVEKKCADVEGKRRRKKEKEEASEKKSEKREKGGGENVV
jgi:hypothetical protein